ncbi:hypothetical protein Megpolyxen_00570 [Candidatus Megaera polyxenophila]|nr:hypothetical protein Megpolyxen_00570 [Candidatus Megaera polyxenophila]
MIRKIALAFIILFVVSWMALAHFARFKVISFINNSQTDNVKISYTDSSISGFPFGWKVRFVSPKITIIDQDTSREIYSDYMDCTFDYKFGKAELNFGKNLYYNSASEEPSPAYKINSEQNIIGFVDFVDVLYKIDLSNSLRKLVKSIEVANPYLTIFNINGEELFNLSEFAFKLSSNLLKDTENFSLNLAGNYKSSFSGSNIINASLILDANYIINVANNTLTEGNNFDHKMEIKHIKISLDNASCDLTGSVALSRNTRPEGKISVELVDYENLVNILVPDDFIFSKSYVKRFIAKAAAIEFSNIITNKVNFDIEFSDKGFVLGNVNLLEQKAN